MAKTITLDIPVRWGDLDAFNHVNNTVFLRYLEEARICFFAEMGDRWADERSGPVVVNVNCNFRREIRYPATVRISLTASAASGKRMLMAHTITDAQQPDILYADAEITAVWVAQGAGAIELPAHVRELLGESD